MLIPGLDKIMKDVEYFKQNMDEFKGIHDTLLRVEQLLQTMSASLEELNSRLRGIDEVG